MFKPKKDFLFFQRYNPKCRICWRLKVYHTMQEMLQCKQEMQKRKSKQETLDV